MAIKSSQIQKLANLAQLKIDSKKINSTTQKINKILDLINQMQSINTDGIVPLAHPLDTSQRLRDDQITEFNQSTLYQHCAPNTEDGLYLVPKVID